MAGAINPLVNKPVRGRAGTGRKEQFRPDYFPAPKAGAPPRLATVSFALGRGMSPSINNRAGLISALVARRRPTLMLCGGYTLELLSDGSVVQAAAARAKSVVLVEICSGDRPSYSFGPGGRCRLGTQKFSERDNTTADRIQLLTCEAEERTFCWGSDETGFLLICGEIGIAYAKDRKLGGWHHDAGEVLQQAIGSVGLVCNPTHTRLGNPGIVGCKRAFLSTGRTYLSSSNWNTMPSKRNGRRQHVSDTLHTMYRNGLPQRPSFEFRDPNFLYREWRK